jgi:cytochrome c biogenesis protein CcmG/thiol:disulfide interchange protein DsbE
VVAPLTVSTAAKEKDYSKLGFRIVLVILSIVLLYRWFGPETSGPPVGSVAKAFSLPVVSDARRTISSEELRGKPVVIEVFAEWCPACKKMAPRLNELARAKRQQPVEFLGVSVEGTPQGIRALKQRWDIPYDVALGDPQFSANYGVSVLPTLIIVNAEGKIVHVSTGLTSTSKVDGWLSELGASRL